MTNASEQGSVVSIQRERDWYEWQANVVAVLEEFDDCLPDITHDDVDWKSWRRLYEEGRSPHDAVDQAVERR